MVRSRPEALASAAGKVNAIIETRPANKMANDNPIDFEAVCWKTVLHNGVQFGRNRSMCIESKYSWEATIIKPAKIETTAKYPHSLDIVIEYLN